MRDIDVLVIDQLQLRDDIERVSSPLNWSLQPGDVERATSDEPFELVLALVGEDDSDALRSLADSSRPPTIVVTESPNIAVATECLRLRLGDYLVWPFTSDQLASSASRLLQDRAQPNNDVADPPVFRPDGIVGESPAMQKVLHLVERTASVDVDVLITGETGTGKELIGRAIHHHGRRRNDPFVPVDCGAIPEQLLESEFFGHEKGAFTGADARRVGLLEFANGGTLFLDEVGELSLQLQAKLLRALQERCFRRVGGREEHAFDVRVVAATGRKLDEMVRQQQFRDDLYYRINVIHIDLPALRDRGDDLGLLAEQFASRYSREMGRPVAGIAPESYQVLSHYHWPGNVRELQNVIRRAIALSSDPLISPDCLPDDVVTSAGDHTDREAGFFQLREHHVAAFERNYLQQLLTRHEGRVASAALEAKVPRGTLYRLMKNHGLDSSTFRTVGH